jgi:hypothetical protein
MFILVQQGVSPYIRHWIPAKSVLVIIKAHYLGRSNAL